MTSHLSCSDRLHKLTVLSVSGSVAAAAGEQTHGSGGRKLWSSPRFTAAFGSALWPSHIPLSWQTHTPLSLSLFISAGSRTVALHSTLINNLYRKTTKRVNWQTPHALTVRLSFSWFFFFFFHFIFLHFGVLFYQWQSCHFNHGSWLAKPQQNGGRQRQLSESKTVTFVHVQNETYGVELRVSLRPSGRFRVRYLRLGCKKKQTKKKDKLICGTLLKLFISSWH